MHHSILRRTSLPLLAAAALAAAPAAMAATQTAHARAVTATFSFRGSFPSYRDETLKITRDGRTAYDAPVTSPWCGTGCAPGAAGRGRSSVHVLDLEHTGSLDVLLDLYSGGAHCCSIEQVFSYDARSGTYVKSQHDFGDPGAAIVDLGHNGRYEFLSADDRFAYEFTDFAASGLPIQILTFSHGRFADVTRHYPKQIVRDAATWMSAFRSQAGSGYQDTTGVVAAWAADEDMLGHTTQVSRFLATQSRDGHLNSALLPGEGGSRFVTALQRFLRKLGYTR